MSRRRLRRSALGLAVALFVLLNGMAIMHGRAMTRFSAAGTRTPRAQELSIAQKLGVVLTGVNMPRRINEEDPSAWSLPFERETFETRDGLTLEAWRVPVAAPRGSVVLFHGYADRKASLLREAQAFHELGYECLLVDFRGAGGSDGDVTSIGYHEAEDVLAAVAHQQRLQRPRPQIVFGVSMGAAATLRAVGVLHASPDVLLLQHPFATLREAVTHRFASNGVPAAIVPLFVFWGGVQQGFDGFRHNPSEYAASVRVPTLLMQGDRDDRVAMSEARLILERLAGRKQFEIFEGLGHVSLLSARPEQWTKAVAEFLTTLHPNPGVEAGH